MVTSERPTARAAGCEVSCLDQVPASHFFMKLAFAAPASFLPSFPTAPASQHFFMELALAAPAKALPSLLTALAAHAAPSWAITGPAINRTTDIARQRRSIGYLRAEALCFACLRSCQAVE